VLWRSDTRHSVKKTVSRLGGAAMLLAFAFTFFFDAHLTITRELYGLLTGTALILIFGLWDDLNELGWKIQIFFQTALTAIVFIFGMRITTLSNPFGGIFIFPYSDFVLPGFLLLLVWIMLVMNAVNWLDGVDGVCAIVSLITLMTIFFLSLKPEVYQPPIALIAIIGIGTVLGFLFFNMYPARILAGTTGSMFLGFLIAILAIIAGTKIATALLVLALPIVDAFFVLWRRIRDGASLVRPDKRHLHYQLMELGWSERRIGWFFFVITSVIAGIALQTQALGKFVALLLVLGIISSFLLFVEHKIRIRNNGRGRKTSQ
ncbi:MAG TPA: MraY family glycosyltransferase, partial [Patescibacteria group bacterium]|nr:MraY family glycosyltransferase [Patescibacteria group bacterium]